MCWGTVREIVVVKQDGKCAICGMKISTRNCVLHHKVNKSQGGANTADNAEARCVKCERWAHTNFPFGNPTAIPQRRYEMKGKNPQRYEKRYRVITRKISRSEKTERTLAWIEEKCDGLHQVRAMP